MSEEKWATEMALKQMMKNPEDHKNFDKAQKSLRIINKERNNLNEKLDVIRSNKLISPDYCEWLVGAIINAERPQETNNEGYDLVGKVDGKEKKYEVKSRQVEHINQQTIFHLKKESLKNNIDLICVLIRPNYEILGIFLVENHNIEKATVKENKKHPSSALGRVNLAWNKKRRDYYERKKLIDWYYLAS
jgi:hypothetical protein